MSDFIRWKEVDILTYLPLFIAKDLEFKAISDADSREHERIRLLLIELLKQDLQITWTDQPVFQERYEGNWKH